MKLPRYSAVKASHRVWLGDVPGHWGVRRLKFQVTKVGSGVTPSGGAESYGLQGIPLLRSQNVHFEGLRLDDVVFISSETHDSMANSKVQPNDVLLNITGASIGRCCIVPPAVMEANVNQHVAVIRSDSSIIPGYLSYLLRADPGQKQIELFQTGSGREGLTFEAIRNFVVPLPEITEQQQIAAFLDWKTGQIDALIQKKQELLEKLKEKRVAVITKAVTQGLNSAAPLRDSGIPWLDQVPEHWEVKRLRFLVEAIDQGWSPMASNVAAEGDQLGVLKLSAVSHGRFVPGENKMLEDVPEDQAIQTPRKHDLLITRANTPELVGDACSVRHDYPLLIIPDLIYRLTVNLSLSEEAFIAYFLLSKQGRALIEANARGSSGSMVKLGQGHLKNLQIPSPPVEEQKIISTYLDEQTRRIDGLMEKINQAINLLTEYRTALITTATTGKIDVRKVRLPGNSNSDRN